MVLVLIALVIAFNFEKFTGQAIKKTSVTKLYVSADPNIADQGEITVDRGDEIYFTVDAGSKGSNGLVIVYDMNGARERRIQSLEIVNCGSNLCKAGTIGTVRSNVYYNWEGKYCARVRDVATKKDVQSCFRVR